MIEQKQLRPDLHRNDERRPPAGGRSQLNRAADFIMNEKPDAKVNNLNKSLEEWE